MQTMNYRKTFLRALAGVVLAAAFCWINPVQCALGTEGNPNPGILPIHASPAGHTYGEWSGTLWKTALELPFEGNPFLEGGCFELSKTVWALASPLGVNTHDCTVPVGKALFVPSLTIECSSLEPEDSGFHGDTEEEQRECAKFWADHIVGLAIEIDDAPVNDVGSYRVVSPQFTFTAPDPNILLVPGGGTGTSVADGYYLMLPPPSPGEHTIRIRGALHFSTAEGDPFDFELSSDVTFRITVE